MYLKPFLLITLCLQISAEERFNPDTVLSATSFDRLSKAEINFVERLKSVLGDLESPTREVAERYLRNFEDAHKNLRNYNESKDMEEKLLAVGGNLIAVHLKVRRFLEDLYPLVEHLRIVQPGMVSAFENRERGYTGSDLNLTMIHIIKTTHAYNLPVSQVADGRFLDIDTGVKLNARHCYDIGVYAQAVTMYVIGLPMLEVAAEKAKEDGTMNETVIESAIRSLIKEHDLTWKTEKESRIQFQNLFKSRLGPLRKRYGENYRSMRISNRVLKVAEVIDYPPNPTAFLEHPFYYDVCTFKNLQSDEEQARLFCWYERTIDPYWYINPLKMELLSSFIEVVQIYDMVGGKLIQYMKDRAIATDTKAGYIDGQVESVHIRESTDPKLRTLPLSFEKLTGLYVNRNASSETLRISVYTPGITFPSHTDQRDDGIGLPPDEKAVGASGIYILEAPELGGETVFVDARFTARPVVGSLLYWIGLKSSGRPDKETIHGGCTPILGRKWLGGKWMYYLDQFQNQRCGRNPNDKTKLFPKSKILRKKYYNKKRWLY